LVKIAKPGRILFATSIAAFGVQNLIWARNVGAVTRIIPWLPGVPLLAYLTGISFLAAGVCIAINLRTRLTAILLGILFLLCEICLQIPRAAASPMDLSLRTVVFEVFSLCAAALLLAGILPEQRSFLIGWPGARSSLIVSGRVLMAVSSVVFGTSHFLVPSFIASLIPPWIPGPGLFWAYFTGFAFVAAGVSIATNWMGSWAAAMLGAMFLFWFLLLHLPRIMSYPHSHDPAEWSSAFIALGLCGGSWIAATALCERRNAFAEGSI
jgi:uncharacterized membrane protein YphA (DoxX/SURF4 family)